jgi:hypothetical protein
MNADLVLVLEPASPSLNRIDARRSPPLGSILVSNIQIDIVALAEACSLNSNAPWCPIAAVVPPDQPVDPRVLSAFEPRHGAIVQVSAEWLDILGDPSSVQDAARRRPPPPASALAHYVRQRTGRVDVSPALEACLEAGLSREPVQFCSHRSTLSRHLSRFGPLKPHDWTRIAHVVQALCGATSQQIPTVEAVALDAGLDPRTFRARLRRYCGCSYQQARLRLGWEWILEAALLKFGYAGTSRWELLKSPRRLIIKASSF